VHAAATSMKTRLKDRGELESLVCSVADLLNTAKGELDINREAAKASISRVAAILSIEINRDPHRRPPRRRTLLGWQVRLLSDYIDAHLAKRILVSDLSTLLQRSEAHFARAFKRTFGVGPHAYVLQRRIEKARQLMLTTDEALIDIALACGMNDQAHLCKLFRQMTGQTPAAWRRERQIPLIEDDLIRGSSVAA
jgi:AraC family transcriptional regulator